jgi:hypothetical protein
MTSPLSKCLWLKIRSNCHQTIAEEWLFFSTSLEISEYDKLCQQGGTYLAARSWTKARKCGLSTTDKGKLQPMIRLFTTESVSIFPRP